jgi:hypothetical protein
MNPWYILRDRRGNSNTEFPVFTKKVSLVTECSQGAADAELPTNTKQVSGWRFRFLNGRATDGQ